MRNLIFMKCLGAFAFLLFFMSARAQEKADTLIGISGNSAFSKYLVQIIGNNKDTISVFDSSKVKLPLQAEYYWVRVYRITYKGDLIEFRVKSFNMVFSDPNGENTTMSSANKFIMDPMLGPFKAGISGSAFSFGQIIIEDEKGREKNLGSFQLFYQ